MEYLTVTLLIKLRLLTNGNLKTTKNIVKETNVQILKTNGYLNSFFNACNKPFTKLLERVDTIPAPPKTGWERGKGVCVCYYVCKKSFATVHICIMHVLYDKNMIYGPVNLRVFIADCY